MSREVDHKIEQIMKKMSKTRKKAEMQQRERKYPLTAEPAVIHPHNSSTMKVRDNGMIDLFVGTDNGVRIDPATKSINFLSNNIRSKSIYEWVETKRNRVENIGQDLVHNVGRDEVHNVKGVWTVHSASSIRFISDGDIYMEARDKIHMKSPHIILDGTIPPDELDPVRPVLGLMFEDQEPWGTEPPFGYRMPGSIEGYERKPRYRREEYDDLHEDSYEKGPDYLPFIRDSKHKRLDVNRESLSAMYRKRYKESIIEIKANKRVDISTLEKESKVEISAKGTESNVNVTSGGKIYLNE